MQLHIGWSCGKRRERQWHRSSGPYLKGLDTWNVLATAQPRHSRQLVRLLKPFGDFRRTRFLGVFVGPVKEPLELFEELRRRQEKSPNSLAPVSKPAPIDATFEFMVDTFEQHLKDALISYADLIDGGSFYVRVERHGHAGEIHSQHVEQNLDGQIIDYVAASGHSTR